MLLHALGLLGESFELLAGGVAAYFDLVSTFAVDLNGQGDRVVDTLCLVVDRPGCVADQLAMAQATPELLAEMGCIGSQDPEKALDRLPWQGLTIGRLVDEDHHLRDRGIHLQALGILADLLDGLV